MKKQIFGFLFLFTPIVSNATGESCNTLLNLGLYNTTQSSSATDAQSLSLSTFCSADYSKIEESSSQAGAVKGSYGLFSAGASASASRNEIITKQSQLCKGDFDSSHYVSKVSDYSKTVYQGSLDAWNKCQSLANKGIIFDIQPSSTLQGVSVSITAPTGLSALFYGVSQSGSGKSNCTVMANGKVANVSMTKPFKFNAASKVTVNCIREMQTNGDDLTADAQDLTFVTSADNLTVPLAAIGNFSRMTADQIKADVNMVNQKAIAQAIIAPINSISTLENSFSLLNNAVNALSTPANTVTVYQCPNGTNGWNPGGAWGFYGCQGQITTSSTCTNLEYPNRQTLNCTTLGILRLF